MPGPSHSSAALAELDMISALEITTGDAIMDAKIRALNNLHSAKVRALMKSVNSLKDQITLLKSQNKEHRRSSLIGGLRDKVKEQELVADVLKEELCKRYDSSQNMMSTFEVNTFVIKRTLGGPKRFRPKSREELQNELIVAEKKLKKALLQSQNNQQYADENTNTSLHDNTNSKSNVTSHNSLPLPPSPTPSTPLAGHTDHGHNDVLLQGQVSELLDEVESLKVSLRSRDTNLAAQMQEMDRLRSENRELRRIEERLAHKEKKHRDLKEKNKDLIRENEKLQEESEVTRADCTQVKQHLEMTKEEGKIEVDSLRTQYGKQMDDLATALQRESELSEQLDRYKGEATAYRQNNYELVRTKDGALADAQKAVQEGKSRSSTMQIKMDKMERENSAMLDERKKMAVTTEKLRSEQQRGREYKREKKEFQDRLEEERKRREKAETDLVGLKERAKSAETQNVQLHGEIHALSDLRSREESLLLESKEDKEAMRRALEGEGKSDKLEAQVSQLTGVVKAMEKREREMTKEVSQYMGELEECKENLNEAKRKLAEAEKTAAFSMKAATIAARADSASAGSEDEKEVVGVLMRKSAKLEEELEKSLKKVKELEKEKEDFRAAAKALKSKVDAAQILKKKQGIALEKAQKDAAEAKKAGGGGGKVDEVRLLLRGAEIEREASEQKVEKLEEDLARFEEEKETWEKKHEGAKEMFIIRLKKIESDAKGGSSEFGALRGEIEATTAELSKERRENRRAAKDAEANLKAHFDAVLLLKEMKEKFKAWGEALAKRLKEEHIVDGVPDMPDIDNVGEEEDDEGDESLNLSDSLSESGTSLSLSESGGERSGRR